MLVRQLSLGWVSDSSLQTTLCLAVGNAIKSSGTIRLVRMSVAGGLSLDVSFFPDAPGGQTP